MRYSEILVKFLTESHHSKPQTIRHPAVSKQRGKLLPHRKHTIKTFDPLFLIKKGRDDSNEEYSSKDKKDIAVRIRRI